MGEFLDHEALKVWRAATGQKAQTRALHLAQEVTSATPRARSKKNH